jgi:tripartite-type tricarboxylate transporter receptor subunit TctC
MGAEWFSPGSDNRLRARQRTEKMVVTSTFRRRLGVLAILTATLGTTNVHAFGAKPIRLVVPYPAGGATDTIARLLAARMQSAMGSEIMVDNRAGVSGTLGLGWFAKAAPDGRTFALGSVTTLAIAPFVLNTSYQPMASFRPVGLVGTAPLYVVVNAKLAVASLDDLASLAARWRVPLAYASVGIGSLPHLAGLRFSTLSGIRMIHVPYQSSQRAVVDLLAGHVQVMFDQLATFPSADLPNGRLKALAVLSSERQPELSDVPTSAEAGYPSLTLEYWVGMLAPAGTPDAIIETANQALGTALADPDLQSRMRALGLHSKATSADAFGAMIADEIRRWKKLAGPALQSKE